VNPDITSQTVPELASHRCTRKLLEYCAAESIQKCNCPAVSSLYKLTGRRIS
jgi:hypothetical protein